MALTTELIDYIAGIAAAGIGFAASGALGPDERIQKALAGAGIGSVPQWTGKAVVLAVSLAGIAYGMDTPGWKGWACLGGFGGVAVEVITSGA